MFLIRRAARYIPLFAAAAAAAVIVAAETAPANAVTNVLQTGPAYVTGYGAAGSPEFGCSSTRITTAGVLAYALPGYTNQHVYAVAHLQYYSNGTWYQYQPTGFNFGLHPNGYQMNPGQYVNFPGLSVPVSLSAYWSGYIEVDWRTSSLAEIGKFYAYPSKQSDYSGKYTYAGLYCAAGPWVA